MKFKTLSGSTMPPKLTTIPDKRGILILREWQRWLSYYLEKTTNNLELIEKRKEVTAILGLISGYLSENGTHEELVEIENFIKKHNIGDYIIVTADELREASLLLEKFRGLSYSEIEAEIAKKEERFGELTNSEYYVLYELTIGSLRRNLTSKMNKSLEKSCKSYLDRIGQEMVYSLELARKDRAYR